MGKKYIDAVKKIERENLFQFPTERMIASISNTCHKRIQALDSEELVKILASNFRTRIEMVISRNIAKNKEREARSRAENGEI